MTGNDCNWTLSQLTRLGHKMCKSFLQSLEQRFQSQCKCMKLEVVYGHAYNLMGNEGPGLNLFGIEVPCARCAQRVIDSLLHLLWRLYWIFSLPRSNQTLPHASIRCCINLFSSPSYLLVVPHLTLRCCTDCASDSQ